MARGRWGGPDDGPASLARGRAVLAVRAGVLAVAGHAAGGGHVPPACGALIAALVLATVATWLAAWRAASARRSSATFLTLAVGQFAVEVLLSAPVDGVPAAPAGALALHAVSTLVLGVLVLGADRVVDDVTAVIDQVLPRWWRACSPSPCPGRRLRVTATPALPVATALRCSGWSPRGPPSAA